MPFTFFRKQILPPTPPRFVKFKARASSLTQGAIENRADQGPRSGANERPVVANRRNRGDSGSRIVAGRDNNLRFAKCGQMRKLRGGYRPKHRAAGYNSGADAKLQSKFSKYLSSTTNAFPDATSPVCVAFVYSLTRLPQRR